MHLDPRESLAGYPILKVRDLLRRGRNKYLDGDLASRVLNISESEAAKALKSFQELGFLKRTRCNFTHRVYWQETDKGHALAIAPASRPLTRKTAEKKLQEFLARVEEVNRNDHYLYKVKRAILFGSYLSDKERIGDIDIAFELTRKFTGEELERRSKAKIRQAKQTRSFGYWFLEHAWPEEEVRLFLKARSRALSLRSTSDTAWQNGPHRMIYEV